MRSPKDWSPADDAKKKARIAEDEAYAGLTTMLEDLKGWYPQIGLSFGYIGNLETWGDDRHWYFFTEVPIQGQWGLDSMKFGSYMTAQLPKFLKDAREKLEPWIRERVLPKVEKKHGGIMSGPKDWAPGPLSTEDARVDALLQRIKKAAEKADLAFWAEIARAFPEATTGDFSPESTFEWDFATKTAILDWLQANYPNDHVLAPIIAQALKERGGF